VLSNWPVEAEATWPWPRQWPRTSRTSCCLRPTFEATHIAFVALHRRFVRKKVERERFGMNLIERLGLLGLSVALLFFGRGRNGEALPIFQKSPWVVSQLFCSAILVRRWSHGRHLESELVAVSGAH
jgi:hypothetical protein